jgi:hypothetical protein
MLESVQAIDKQIRALEQERNSSSPLWRLPVELLLKILRGCCSAKDLLSMNAVCQRFKCITDDERILWTTPPLAHGDTPDRVAELFIRRSGSAPLVFFPTQPSNQMAFYSALQLEIIASQLHRVRTLKVAVAQNRNLEAFLDLLHQSALQIQIDQMEELSLIQNDTGAAIPPLIITSALCGGRSLCLTHLTLVGMRVIGLPSAPSLQQLTLEDVGCTYRALRNGLIALSSVTRLKICNVHLSYDLNTPNDPIELNHLMELHLELTFPCLSATLDLLPDPRRYFTIKIKYINAWRRPSLDDPHIHKMLTRLTGFCNRATGRSTFPMGSCASRLDNDRYLDPEHYVELGCPRDRISLEDRPGVFVTFQLLDLITPSPYMSQITDMRIDHDFCNDYLARAHEIINFDFLTGVKSLTLHQMGSKGGTRALLAWHHHPALLTIYEWMMKRKESGAPLSSVMFYECTVVLEPFFEHIRDTQAAQNVHWEMTNHTDWCEEEIWG